MEHITSAIVNGRVKVVRSKRVRGIEHKYTLEYSCTPAPTKRKPSKEMLERKRKMRELKDFVKKTYPERYARLFQNVNTAFLERIS